MGARVRKRKSREYRGKLKGRGRDYM